MAYQISLQPPTTPGPNQTVEVTVTSVDGSKGTVDISYSCPDPEDQPLYIDPSSNSVYVPAHGSATTSVTVGLSTSQSVTLQAVGGGSSASCVVSN